MAGPRVVGSWGRAAPTPAVMLGLAGFVVTVYVVIVLGGGTLIGRTDSPSLPLSVLATSVVALMFAPVHRGLERLTSSADGGATPYDVLSRFSETVTGGYTTEELPARMARLLAEGTGAAWAQVWLSFSSRLTLAATWPHDPGQARNPPDPPPATPNVAADGRRTLPVLHGGRTLGVLVLKERAGLPLTSVEERLFTGLAAQAGLVLRLAGLRAELEERHEELVTRAGELKASRQRLIETHDSERQRLERDIHDGAQQHLVALAVNLQLAQTIAERSPRRAAHVLAVQADAAREAIGTLSSLSRGIYPSLLSDDGLVPALRAGVAASAIPVTLQAEGVGRLDASIEAALYFCCMEAVQNAAKHSGASVVTVQVSEGRASSRLVVADDGVGFDHERVMADGAGAGLVNMHDRLDAVGGTATVRSTIGSGTTVTAEVAGAAGGSPALAAATPVVV